MTRSSPPHSLGRSTLQRLQSERGFVWWPIIAAIVVVVVVAAVIITYLATKGSGTVTNPPMPKVCAGGSVDVKAYLRGAGANQNYEITVTATRRCELGQNCMCAGTSGTFGTPTTPCDSYDGVLGPVTAMDTIAGGPLVTEYTKRLDNLREGIWEVQISVRVQGLTAVVVKTCCVIVKSGQTSSLEYFCQRVLLPGSTCPDCTTNTTPGEPTGGPSTTTPP